MIDILINKKDEIAQVCREYGIARLEVFGSAASGEFTDESDFDFIVDLGGYERGVARRFIRFAEALETLLGRKVDLITENQIRNPYFERSVNRQRETIYGPAGQEKVA